MRLESFRTQPSFSEATYRASRGLPGRRQHPIDSNLQDLAHALARHLPCAVRLYALCASPGRPLVSSSCSPGGSRRSGWLDQNRCCRDPSSRVPARMDGRTGRAKRCAIPSL